MGGSDNLRLVFVDDWEKLELVELVEALESDRHRLVLVGGGNNSR